MDNIWLSQIIRNLELFERDFVIACQKAGRKKEDVQILYATKYLQPHEFLEFVNFLHDTKRPIIIGENRIQDGKKKLDFVKNQKPILFKYITPISIGTLQTNKINTALTYFSEIHSVDSLDLAVDLNNRLARSGKTLAVYIEVNASGEQAKHGLTPSEFPRVYTTIQQLKYIHVKGLMTMAPLTENVKTIHNVFRKARTLANTYGLLTSMGMSHDWKIALEEGSVMIRIGSAIFS
ncbi:YggS family pyridoxal phosphate-dependent enzyme [Candidatus Gottesmanbacteria bacterium]|nr:YggS family pyridoxal phosphate-dependent enzyme [Candidatus Gottesmanbacteria bacterium]